MLLLPSSRPRGDLLKPELGGDARVPSGLLLGPLSGRHYDVHRPCTLRLREPLPQSENKFIFKIHRNIHKLHVMTMLL